MSFPTLGPSRLFLFQYPDVAVADGIAVVLEVEGARLV
ncbi:uncharacterized protein METZ01_LOCUS319971, partial [marine metagenome]